MAYCTAEAAEKPKRHYCFKTKMDIVAEASALLTPLKEENMIQRLWCFFSTGNILTAD